MKSAKRVMYCVCAVLLLWCGWNLWMMRESERKNEQMYDSLAEHTAPSETTEGSVVHSMASDVQGSIEAPVVNPWLEERKVQNEELFGWIIVPNSVINYPVMQTTKDNDYYLDHDFLRNSDSHGTPFLDVRCNLEHSDNLIVYGHHMADGTMFQNLMYYKNADYCENNDPIQFLTAEKTYQYEVVRVLVISAEEAEDFPYYQYVNFEDEADFQNYWRKSAEFAVWSGHGDVSYGEKLLTLSTCEYSKENGRLVVIARRMKA